MTRTIKEIREDQKKAELEAKKIKPKSTKVIKVDPNILLKKSY